MVLNLFILKVYILWLYKHLITYYMVGFLVYFSCVMWWWGYQNLLISFEMAGFECEFVEQPPQIIQTECPICLLVLREPFQVTCCGKSYCKECIEQIKASTQDCPTCNVRNIFSYPNLGLQQSLYDFHVYCTHKSKGCEWTGELRELDNHLNSDPPADKFLEGCPFTVINCPLSCAGCETGVCRKDVKAHVNDKMSSHVMTLTAQMKFLRSSYKKTTASEHVLSLLKEVNSILNSVLQNWRL